LPVTVRPARLADAPGIRACLDVVARERRYLVFLKAPSLRASRIFYQGIIKKNYPLEIAVADKRVVGWCDICPSPQEIFSHSGRLGMGVHPEYRGQGVGRRLIAAALEKARRRGLERIELDVFADNVPARRLYESVGFTVEGVRRRYRKLDGKYDDNVLMALLLVN
jgi:RimJ/RimL family protein N-acetyltransferase